MHNSKSNAINPAPSLQSPSTNFLQSVSAQTIAFAVDEAIFRSQQREKGWSDARWVIERDQWRIERMERLLRSKGKGEEDAKNVENVVTGEKVAIEDVVDTEETVQTGEDEMTGIGMEERIS